VDRLILETTFLIDLERETRGIPGAAMAFLERHKDTRLFITMTVAGELAAGPSLAERDAWQRFVAPFHVLPINLDAAWHYGRIYTHLRTNGALIGSNDLWIAATALANGMPVATANLDHYQRVPGLEVIRYMS
jgi:predicted nucleic acid-binding protein